MESVRGGTGIHMEFFKIVRIYLQIIYMSDLALADGEIVLENMLYVKYSKYTVQTSKLSYPRQG